MSGNTQWRDVPASVISEKGILRLREPPGADLTELLERLRNDDYSKPFVWEDDGVRRLHFGFKFVQSEMRLDQPYALNFAYTRKMMAFLLFQPAPRQIVIVGLGGGSLTKFCYQQLPRTRITTVEIDEDVIAFSELFHVPGQDARMRIVHADAGDYFAGAGEHADVIMLDGCDKRGVAPVFCDAGFYRNLRARLRPDGLLVVNLIGGARRANELQQLIADAFEDRVMVIDIIRSAGNRIVFAFNDPDFSPDWRSIKRQAGTLSAQYSLDFAAFARRLQHSHLQQVNRHQW